MSNPGVKVLLMSTRSPCVADALADLARRFAAAGIDSARIDARLLVARAVGLEQAALTARPGRALSPEEQSEVERMAQRRLAREPVTRILERRGFYGLDLAVTPATLDPRPETETVVEEVLTWARQQSGDGFAPRIIDLGTGSGALLLALLANLPAATGVGTDISADALDVAGANARKLRLDDRARFQRSDWLDEVSGQFDIVVSNPPYIASGLLSALDPEVARYDPRIALDGGRDGLEAYRRIAVKLDRVLVRGGAVAFEIGHDQSVAVTDLLHQALPGNGRHTIRTMNDLAGQPRCVIATT